MTERSQGAPDPAAVSTTGSSTPDPLTPEPFPTDSRSTDPRSTDSRTAGAVVAFPALAADLGAARRTDALIDALAARRAAGSDDPAVRMLRALIRDVDELVPVRHGPAAGQDAVPDDPVEDDRPLSPVGPRRRGPRTIVALGVAGAVLAGTGVAAAGGMTGQPAPSQAMGPVEEGHSGAPDTTDSSKAVLPFALAPVRAVPSGLQRTEPGETGKDSKQASRVKHRIAGLPESTPRPRRAATESRAVRPQTEDFTRMQRRLEELGRRVQERTRLPADLGDRDRDCDRDDRDGPGR
ncbi:hypothetical protein [Actinomadura sp. 9N407]|uniref:hypothetical protein n=1 Tax=Actinomadura sp. 9N407 TaxID=3375154 RepID=UPI003799DCF4